MVRLITGAIVSCAIIFITCSPAKLEEKIGNLELELGVLAGEGKLSPTKVQEYIDLVEKYVKKSPDSPDSPEYLRKAAELATSQKMTTQAMTFYDKILSSYPDYPKYSQTLFLKAFTLENEIKDLEGAKKLYEDFLQRYPNDEFADDAQFLLKNLGKSDEEIIQGFMQGDSTTASGTK